MLSKIEGTMSFRHILQAAAVVLLIGPLAGCGASLFGGDNKPTVETKPPDVLYKEADKLLNDNDYTKAAQRFEEVDRQHPPHPRGRGTTALGGR